MGGRSSKPSLNNDKRAQAQAQITDIDRAVLDLKNTRDKLTKYTVQLETSIEKLMIRAKTAKEQNKPKTALGLLRLKKYKQAQVESVQTQLLNVHTMIGSIDSQQQNNQIVISLKAGKDALAKLHQETTVEDVLDLMDEIKEQNEMEQEINDVLNGAVPTLTADQEVAVEAEFAALQAEMEGTTTTTAPAATEKEEEKVNDLDMPQVPDDKLPELKEPKVAEKIKQQQSQRVALPG